MNLWEFDYEYNRELLLKEAKGNGYEPFTDIGNGSDEPFQDWKIKHLDLHGKVIQFYKHSRILVSNADDCPYALEIAKYFIKRTGFVCSPRFYFQKKGFSLPLHKDRGTECSINFVLGDDPDPIRFKDEELVYTTGLLNTQSLHGVEATKDRYLFKLSFKKNTFYEVMNRLSET